MARHLATAGIPVVAASDLTPPGVHEHRGSLMTFWRHLPHDPDATVPPEVLGGMLRDAHQALVGCRTPLPHLATPLQDVSRFLDRADPAETGGMRRTFERVVRELPDDASQPLTATRTKATCSPQRAAGRGPTSRTPAPVRSRGTWRASPPAVAPIRTGHSVRTATSPTSPPG